jgi:hypothetical protein
MTTLYRVIVTAAVMVAAPQQQPSPRDAPGEVSQFAFLLGQWDLTVTPVVSGLAARIHGVPKSRGSWMGWRAFDGWGIEDELRVVDASGNPQALLYFVRIYDPVARSWTVSAVDTYRGLVSRSVAEWRDGEMTLTGDGTDAGKPFRSRTRISAITPSSFHVRQDRSYDGGKTWEDRLLIDAKRVAPVAPRRDP